MHQFQLVGDKYFCSIPISQVIVVERPFHKLKKKQFYRDKTNQQLASIKKSQYLFIKHRCEKQSDIRDCKMI